MRRGELLERTLASTRQPDEAAAAETARRLDADGSRSWRFDSRRSAAAFPFDP